MDSRRSREERGDARAGFLAGEIGVPQNPLPGSPVVRPAIPERFDKGEGVCEPLRMKTRILLSIALIGTLAFGLAAPAAAQDKKADPTKDLLGTWDAQTEDGGRSLVFKFFMEKDELKGLYTGQAGESKMEDLKVEGNKATFVVKVGGDQGMVISFTAFFTGEEMNGMLSLQFGEANFTGKKRK